MPDIDSLPSGSSQQRHHLNHQAIEDYLKSIFTLAQVESPVTTSSLAEARGVRPASATSMVQRLAKLNLVHYEKHYGVTLTETGRAIALEVIRHHRLIELYLIEALGFRWDEVHEQADLLEHVISEKLEDRIAAALNHPKYDPHGAPIPSKQGSIVTRPTMPLIELPVGQSAFVAQILVDEDVDLLRYLSELGLNLGAEVTVLQIAPMQGPRTLRVGNAEQVIGYNVAATVMVELTAPAITISGG